MGKRRSSAEYKRERKKYKKLFKKVWTHHMHPHERGGPDNEFNLFPWNKSGHTVWHLLFHNLTVREVWSILDAAWELIWGSGAGKLKPVWRWQYRELFKPEEQIEFHKTRDIVRWQRWWLNVFGGRELDQARYLLRCMMLTMALGHRAYTRDVECTPVLKRLVRGIPPESDRAWAFIQCFHRPLNTDSYRTLKRQIRHILDATTQARPS